MADQLEIFSRENIEIIYLVQSFFNDFDKTKTWLNTPNPHLGQIEPAALMLRARSKKVLTFIKTSLEENKS